LKVAADPALPNTPLSVFPSFSSSLTLAVVPLDGAAKAAVMVADFQSLDGAGDSGTNVFQAGDLLGISLTNSQNLNVTTKYIWSFVFELDFNSY